MARLNMPEINATEAGKAALEQYDTNKDGKIAGSELDKAPALQAALKRIDTNNDNAITADEITARINKWKEQKAARLAITCTVTQKGKPLEGATVTLVPERFLGDAVMPATGVTGKAGTVSPSIKASGPDDRRGVAPGFYRVEITKAGEKIPEKYNKQTTLGVEVAADSPAVRQGVTWDLAY